MVHPITTAELSKPLLNIVTNTQKLEKALLSLQITLNSILDPFVQSQKSLFRALKGGFFSSPRRHLHDVLLHAEITADLNRIQRYLGTTHHTVPPGSSFAVMQESWAGSTAASYAATIVQYLSLDAGKLIKEYADASDVPTLERNRALKHELETVVQPRVRALLAMVRATRRPAEIVFKRYSGAGIRSALAVR